MPSLRSTSGFGSSRGGARRSTKKAGGTTWNTGRKIGEAKALFVGKKLAAARERARIAARQREETEYKIRSRRARSKPRY